MEIQEEGTFWRCSILRRNVFDIWHSKQGTGVEKCQHVLSVLTNTSPLADDIENIDLKVLSDKITSLRKRLSSYWLKTNRTKSKLIKQFREKLGLIVDKPKSGGSGTSNDGNTARRFFSNSEISAKITGIKKNLLDRCWTILQCINSGYNIDQIKFREFTLETARQIVAEYPWYYMPASVHKILIHGASIIDHGLLSIGELSEEAAEACNKYYKEFRRNHTRKMSRVLTNTDLINRLFLHSDPLISALRKLPVK